MFGPEYGYTMKTAKPWTMRVSAVATLVVCLAAAFVGVRALMGYGVTFYRSFEKVQQGMLEAEAVAILGAADERSAEFRLGQYEGFEKEYARAAGSGSSYYLLWFKSIDVVYAIGFDRNGRVTMKAVGGT